MKSKYYLLTAAVLSASLTSCNSQIGVTVLPDFINSSSEEICLWIEEHNIQADFIFQENTDYEEGLCISSQPKGQSVIEEGSTVTFVIAIHPAAANPANPIPVPVDPTIKVR